MPQIGVSVQVISKFNLTPQDLKGYKEAYPDAPKEVTAIIKATIDHQASSDYKTQENNTLALKNQSKILDNQKELLKNTKTKDFLSFMLSLAAFGSGLYLINHPATTAQFTGVVLVLGVALSAFQPKIIDNLKSIFKKN